MKTMLGGRDCARTRGAAAVARNARRVKGMAALRCHTARELTRGRTRLTREPLLRVGRVPFFIPISLLPVDVNTSQGGYNVMQSRYAAVLAGLAIWIAPVALAQQEKGDK